MGVGLTAKTVGFGVGFGVAVGLGDGVGVAVGTWVGVAVAVAAAEAGVGCAACLVGGAKAPTMPQVAQERTSMPPMIARTIQRRRRDFFGGSGCGGCHPGDDGSDCCGSPCQVG